MSDESRGSKTDAVLSREKIGKAAPVCPSCKEPLVMRGPERRFPEDDRYQECINGHVWTLSQVLVSDGKALPALAEVKEGDVLEIDGDLRRVVGISKAENGSPRFELAREDSK